MTKNRLNIVSSYHKFLSYVYLPSQNETKQTPQVPNLAPTGGKTRRARTVLLFLHYKTSPTCPVHLCECLHGKRNGRDSDGRWRGRVWQVECGHSSFEVRAQDDERRLRIGEGAIEFRRNPKTEGEKKHL